MSDKQELPNLNRQRHGNAKPSPAEPASSPSSGRRRHVGSTADYIDTTPKVSPHSQPSPEDVDVVPTPSAAITAPSAKDSGPSVPRPSRAPAPPEVSDPSVICFAVKQETLVLAALVMSSLLLASFIFGHKVGYNKYARRPDVRRPVVAMIPSNKRASLAEQAKPTVREADVPAADAPQETHAPGVAQNSTSGAKVWTLCVISYKITQRSKADDLVSILSKAIPDQKVFLKRSDKAWTVCVGQFPGSKDGHLISLRDTIRKMIYHGKPHFADCYPMRLQG